MNEKLILSHEEILRKITRLAFEVVERNFEENELIFAGIDGTGYILAQKMAEEVQKIHTCAVSVIKVSLNKAQPTQSEILLDVPRDFFEGKCIILTDDVLNTGRTAAYGLKPFLYAPVKKLETLFLVDRAYHNFPIAAEYCGYSLSTTLMQHILVEFKDEKWAVFLL